MTPRLLAVLSATCVASVLVAATPDRLPGERYTRLRAEAPFALSTAPVKLEPREPWEQNLYIASAARIQRGGIDHDWVVLRDRTQAGRIIQLVDGEPKDGYELLKLEWSPDPRQTKASVKKDGECRQVTMDRAAFLPDSVAAPRPASLFNPGATAVRGGRARVQPIPVK